jgi:hypothetical protein
MTKTATERENPQLMRQPPVQGILSAGRAVWRRPTPSLIECPRVSERSDSGSSAETD